MAKTFGTAIHAGLSVTRTFYSITYTLISHKQEKAYCSKQQQKLDGLKSILSFKLHLEESNRIVL